MPQEARLLHITDSHLKVGGSAFPIDDRTKANPGLEPQTREIAFEDALKRVSETLAKAGEKLDGVIFGGDALSAGQEGGDKLLLELILTYLEPRGICAKRILAVPGNHDMSQKTPPTSEERYARFQSIWRDAGCVTPWLDGVDKATTDFSRHVLLAEDLSWAVVAVNSCNWSHVDALSPQLRRLWASIPAMLAGGDAELAKALGKELDKLARYDMARVSPDQLDALRTMLRSLPTPHVGQQLRMMVLHHHMRAPALTEEVKPFADLSNLEQVRAFVAEQNIRVVMHGHKHEGRIHSDYIELPQEGRVHKALMIAGGSFGPANHSDAMRVLHLTGLPWTPSLQVQSVAIPRKGLNGVPSDTTQFRLWESLEVLRDAPVVVQGTDYDAVYARVQKVSDGEAEGKMLIVHLDLDDFSAVSRLPHGYPGSPEDSAERIRWLGELVDWWQLPQSQLQQRVPYLHGTRLRRFASDLDQIQRVSDLLKGKQTTRAIAMLIDPAVDFKETDPSANFASFCLVQFSRRDVRLGESYVDCVGYYRAQEMVKWWPINVAELHKLAVEVGESFNAQPGRITTITACARSLARSPTHVTMPVIDRWLDQSPEKYFVLANALLSEMPLAPDERRVLTEWNSCLTDLIAAAEDGSGDGGPVVAINGPRHLAKYLNTGRGKRAQICKDLAEKLETLARWGGNVPPSTKQAALKEWYGQLAKLLGEIRQSCRVDGPQ